jgi:hypothetical protein
MTRVEVIDLKQYRLVNYKLVDGLPISLDSDLNLLIYDEKNGVPGLTLFALNLRPA